MDKGKDDSQGSSSSSASSSASSTVVDKEQAGPSTTKPGRLITLRLRTDKSASLILRDVNEEDSLADFFLRISALVHIPTSDLVLLSGFPPKRLKFSYTTSLKSLGLSSQDTIIVEQSKDANLISLVKKAEHLRQTLSDDENDGILVLETLKSKDSATSDSTTPPLAITNFPSTSSGSSGASSSRRSKSSVLQSTDESKSRVVEVVDLEAEQIVDGILLRRVIPSDNSCLFSSVIFGLNGETNTNLQPPQLRKIIADTVGANPEHYNEIFLGRPNKDYQTWIMNDQSWGGAIELAILAEYYEIEIAVMNIEAMSIQVFGETMGYATRIYLIYDGIHYDCLFLEAFVDYSTPRTVFNKNDQDVYSQALEIGREAFNSKQFTNVNEFTLKCTICGQKLKGHQEARVHTQDTSHVDFEETAGN